MAKNQKKKNQEKRKNSKAQSGSGLITQALLPLSIAIFGLVITFGLIWWQAIAQPAQEAALVESEQAADQYQSLINSRIAELQSLVNTMATAPATLSAMASYDPAQRTSLGAMFAASHPHIVRVDLIEKGTAEVDLNAAVPLSFAALDLIRRAETQAFVGPEVSLNQRNLIYAAQPITPDGVVAGVLLVVFDSQYFLQALDQFNARSGMLELHQKFAGTPSTVVMQWGAGQTLDRAVETDLIAMHWTLSFRATTSSDNSIAQAMNLAVPFAVSLLVVIGAILLGLAGFSRKVKADAETLTEFSTRVVRGRPVRPGSFNIAALGEVAAALMPHAKEMDNRSIADRAGATEPKLTSSDSDKAPDTPVDDTQALLDELDKDDTEDSEDFLDVSNSAVDDNFGIEVSEDTGPLAMGLNLDAGIFRAYDIRGITTENLTEEVVYWIGRAFASEAAALGQTRVAIGWDGRHSSEPLRDSLAKGLNDSGADVITIGQVPTPMLYYATYALNTGTGIMITGSHNPPEYNGLKMMIDGITLAEDKIQRLLRRIQDNDLADGHGEIEEIDLDDSYIDKVLEDIALAQPLKVVVDCGNGVAGKIAPRLLEELGCEVIPLYCEVDGDFPNHHPDPAEPQNLEDLITVVKAEKADIGLAFDGDGDRLGVVTNSGEIIWPDKMIMLFAQDIVSRNPGADIIYDVKCSRHLNNLISELGGRPIMWKTGHSHIKAKIKETGALLGGEFSGHICFGERWYGFDDALYSAVRLLEILGSQDKTVDEVFAQFPVTFTTPEIKINTTESAKFEIMQKLEAQADFGDGTVTSIDGIRVDFADGWGLVRPSNTSPVLSLRFEADGPAALDRIQDEFQAQLHRIDPALNFR